MKTLLEVKTAQSLHKLNAAIVLAPVTCVFFVRKCNNSSTRA